MKRHITVPFALITVIGLAWAGLYSRPAITSDVRIDNHGKYLNLLHVINEPQDMTTYGDFCDWGYWNGTAWGTHTGLNPGFWVYVYPNWYVWEKIAEEQGLESEASANGKYAHLLFILKVPQDTLRYGTSTDFGFSECYDYAGYEALSPGYWVYFAPNWYVWADTHDDTQST